MSLGTGRGLYLFLSLSTDLWLAKVKIYSREWKRDAKLIPGGESVDFRRFPCNVDDGHIFFSGGKQKPRFYHSSWAAGTVGGDKKA